MSEQLKPCPIQPDAKQIAGRLYGLQEAAVIAGETSVGLAIYERIKELEASARADDRWIPVSERQPGPTKNPEKVGHSYWGIYIVVVHSPNISPSRPIVIPANWTGEWRNDGGFPLNVTHWRPLPAPPEMQQASTTARSA